jgi:hypothetical protein
MRRASLRCAATACLSLLVTGSVCLVQVSEVKKTDEDRVNALRSGEGAEKFYTVDYLGFLAGGNIEDRTAVAKRPAVPAFTLENDVWA